MDYVTKAASREDMRTLSVLFRHLFNADAKGKFSVLRALEIIPDVFPGTIVSIVSDDALPYNTPARCSPDNEGNFLIEIKDSVYKGAHENEIGAYRGFICHEMCHVFLYKAGFTPIFNRQFKNNVIPAFRSVEWQTKALCGEVMMPYEETKNMPIAKLIGIYGVSKASAEMRLKY